MQFCILPWHHFLATDAFGLTPPTTKTPCNCTVHNFVVACNCTHLHTWPPCSVHLVCDDIDLSWHHQPQSLCKYYTTTFCSFGLDAMPSPPLWMQVIWRCREEGEPIWTRPAVCHFNFITFHHPVQWIFMNIIFVLICIQWKVAQSV